MEVENCYGRSHRRTFTVNITPMTLHHFCAVRCLCTITAVVSVSRFAFALLRFAVTLSHFVFGVARDLSLPAVPVTCFDFPFPHFDFALAFAVPFSRLAVALERDLHLPSLSLALALPSRAAQRTPKHAEPIRSETQTSKFWSQSKPKFHGRTKSERLVWTKTYISETALYPKIWGTVKLSWKISIHTCRKSQQEILRKSNYIYKISCGLTQQLYFEIIK